jgi:hypothetical protein
MLIRFPRSSRWYTFTFVIIFAFITTTATSALAQTKDVSDASKSIREGLNKVW